MDMVRARKAMVDSQVRPNDVPDLRLQKAMGWIPREQFVPANRRGAAYTEKDLLLFEGRWLLKARDFSKLVHALHVGADDLVLDVACGFGYSSAVLSQLAEMVIAVEDHKAAVEKGTEILTDLEFDNVALVEGVLTDGAPGQGPFDVILIAGGVEQVPSALFDQLKPGGRLGTILVDKGIGHATLFVKADGVIGERTLFEASPAGIVPGFEKAREFSF